MSASSCATYPENSCPRVSGTASCRCVRPIFTMSANPFAFASSASRSSRTRGRSRSTITVAPATCIAVGNVSFDDCDRLTWSLGCTGVFDPSCPPASSIARFAITSFAFMFVWVPEPVCQTKSGKWSSSEPAMTSSAAFTIRSPIAGSRTPSSMLACAAAFLRMPIAWTISSGIRSTSGQPIEKWWIERSVCAPQ